MAGSGRTEKKNSFSCFLGIEEVYGPQEECYACFDPNSASSIQKALEDLKEYLEADGPFDGVMAFSQGAALAALLLVEESVNRAGAGVGAGVDAEDEEQRSSFKCAVFLSGIVPCDVASLARGSIRWLDPRIDGEIIRLPTAHIWGKNDSEYPGISEGLGMLCCGDMRRTVVHEGGHEVPGSQDESLEEMVKAIEETIGLAMQLGL